MKQFPIYLSALFLAILSACVSLPNQKGSGGYRNPVGKIHISEDIPRSLDRTIFRGMALAKRHFLEVEGRKARLERTLHLKYSAVSGTNPYGAMEVESGNAVIVTLFKLDENLERRVAHEFLHAFGIEGHPERYDGLAYMWSQSRRAQPWLERP